MTEFFCWQRFGVALIIGMLVQGCTPRPLPRDRHPGLPRIRPPPTCHGGRFESASSSIRCRSARTPTVVRCFACTRQPGWSRRLFTIAIPQATLPAPAGCPIEPTPLLTSPHVKTSGRTNSKAPFTQHPSRFQRTAANLPGSGPQAGGRVTRPPRPTDAASTGCRDVDLTRGAAVSAPPHAAVRPQRRGRAGDGSASSG